MGRASRDKGKRGERLVRDAWKRLGFADARRGQQHSGSPDSPDVIVADGIHCEAKFVERLNIWAALEQAIGDCGENIPVVAFKRSRSEVFIALRMSDLGNLSRKVVDVQDHGTLPGEDG